MYRGIFAFAGVPVEIISRNEYAIRRCEAYRCAMSAAFSAQVSADDIARTRAALARRGDDAQAFSEGYLEFEALLVPLQQQFYARDTLLFHASAVAVDGEAYLFAAKSGTGKSTHARYWREYFGERVVVINDDTPFLRVADGNVTVYGSPWCGKHKLNTNTSAPVRAICLLERSAENFLQPLTAREAFPILYRQTCQAKDGPGRLRELALLDMLSKSVQLYRLGVNMSPEAARFAYEGINGGIAK